MSDGKRGTATAAPPSPPHDRDAGVAALELALVLGLIFALLALVVPLGVVLRDRLALDRAAGQTIRFATAVKAGERNNTQAEVAAEAQSAWAAAGGDGTVTAVLGPLQPDPGCATRRLRTVTLSTPVDLGAFDFLFRVAGTTAGTPQLTASATSCEE